MGYDLTKRLSALKAQTDPELEGRLSLWATFVQGALIIGLIAFFISAISTPEIDPRTRGEYSVWQTQTKIFVEERKEYLLDSMLLGETRARLYLKFANGVISLFGVGEPSRASDRNRILDFEAWGQWIAEALAGLLLRGVFIFFACAHLWFIGVGIGFALFRFFLLPKKTRDILGILDRGRSAFYSGIYGPLRPNRSMSGTDLSCPSLACPKMAPQAEAKKHRLATILERYRAMNGTNLGLTQVILAYRDYPSAVDEERIIEEGEETALPTSSFRTNEDGTIEESAVEYLEATLKAHALLREHYAWAKESENPKESDYAKNTTTLAERAEKLSPLARQLVLCLTPARGLALAQLPAQAVASACLAIEAGKYLVYRREGNTFFPISRFPHLQARAVIQSLVSYHDEYSGDLRMSIRQAIISSRRHGDFGRAFLPVHMSMASRGLRDWLEVQFSSEKRRDGFARLVELDAHLEEIQLNFRKEFIKQLVSNGMLDRSRTESTTLRGQLWKGISYKSVVLIPLKDLVAIALQGISTERLDRITHLMQETRKLQASLSISARLPGFKRQAEVAEKDAIESGGITRVIAETDGETKLLAGWLIIRRMLTRYNWLSTRVGDSAVPPDGLIQAVALDRATGERPEVLGLDALVPLRQRRFKELLGSRWEAQYYAHSPSANDVDIYEERADFEEGLALIREQVSRGLFDRQKVVN